GDEQRDLAVPQRLPPFLFVDDARQQRGRFLQRREPLLRGRTVRDADRHLVRRLVAKREAEGEREEKREAEDPENRLGLAQELLRPRNGQLDDRRSHRPSCHATLSPSARRTSLRASPRASTA